MTSFESNSPPQPVSSLRSRFEQIAAASSPPPVRATSPAGYRAPARLRASSITNLKQHSQQLFLDPKRIVSGPCDVSSMPVLRASPSSPDLKDPGRLRPAPPPPRGSRTPSPQPPSPPPPTPPPANSSVSVQPTHTKTNSLTRRPPPPPRPVKSAALRVEPNGNATTLTDSKVDSESTLPSGGVASLRSKFIGAAISSPEYFGSDRPVSPSASRNKNLRSISTTVPPPPPALPARPSNDRMSSIKGPRASLPSITTLPNGNSPTRPTPLPSAYTLSPSSETLSEEPTSAISRPPPPVPSRNNTDLLARAANTVVQHRVNWAADADRPEHSRNSSESTSSGSVESEHGAASATSSLRRVPPRPPVVPPVAPVASSGCPPPLPRRPNVSDEVEETSNAPPPPLPSRPSCDPVSTQLVAPVAPKPTVRIQDVITPPPARAIGLNGKLPRARRRSSGESDDSDDEPVGNDRTQTTSRQNRTLEDLPDSTHCSRRLPMLPDYKYAKARIHVAASSGVVAFAGQHVVVAGHHHAFTVYDLSLGDAPVSTVDLKELAIDWRLKDPRITAMEFRAGDGDESGRFLWCGSKDGHVWEFDVQHRTLVRARSAHVHPVVHIMRYGRSMITLDDSGKALIWKDYQDLNAGGQPRIARTADKQGFVKMFGGLLWTSNGTGSGTGGGAAGSQKGPIIRVYDILSSNCMAKMITPPDVLGAVTSGAVVPSQSEFVYLGHEGGYVTCWSLNPSEASSNGILDTFDSGSPVPTCVQVIRISVSDVLSLEGVVDRLWMGSRKGTITAYDVQTKPWTITNAWQAHDDLPVLKVVVDPFSVRKSQRLHVVSVGRDEQLHFWDGLLGTDWVEAEVQRRETEFSTFRDINILICSWNTDAQKPEALTGSADNVNLLENVLHSVDSPDIIAFGFQELIDLESRSLTAKSVLLGNQKKKNDGVISEKVSRSYRMWHERLVQAVRIAMPVDDPYVVAHTDSLVGLFSCIFVRQRQRHLLRDSAMAAIKRGMGGRYGNKGAILARFVIDDSSLCFINCHLAAGQSHTRARNQDLAAILEDGTALPSSDINEALPYVGGGDGSMILDHEICFLGGDLNYRIDQRREAVINAVNSKDLDFLLIHDQLRKQAKTNPGFRLRTFTEAPITFAPTYKYDPRTSDYDTSEKRRAPAWCDRILYRCRDPSRVQVLHYRRYEANVSDHRPISAAFRATVKSIDQEARATVKSQVQELWQERELSLLFEAQDFYTTHHIL